MKREELMERVDGALANLETDLSNGTSETMQNFLQFLARFHNYSFGNVMLIAMQNPEATLVAGYQKWKSMGRQVRKGEKGIRILAPMMQKQKKEEEAKQSSDDKKSSKRIVGGFRVVSVFDVSQTDGEEIPSPLSYSGDPAENLERLKQFIASQKIELLMVAPLSGALGTSEEGCIRIRPDLDPAETFAVMVHETAHELLHKGDRRKETTKTIRETEAEAVAYAVCSAVGLDAGKSASDYIQLQQGDAVKLRDSLEIIRKAASQILEALEVEAVPVAH